MRVISLSLVSILSLSTAIIAGDDIKPTNTEVIEIEEPKESFGTLSGQFRTFYIDRTYTGILENNRNSLNTGGHIGYDTKSFNGLSLGLRAYGTYGFEIHDEDKSSKKYDPSLFGDDFDDYAFIGQAYLNYKNGNTNIKIGRQRLDTPLAGADDARMLPNLFEAVIISNTDLADTTLIAGHVTKETVGTFGNVYGEAGALSLQSGYGLGYKLGTSGEFATMGEIALGEGADTDGVSALAFIYTGVEGLKLQAWDYYAHDILNALYLQADYKYSGVTASAQYINETDTGDALAGEVDSNYLGFKLGTTYQNLSGYVAYSMTDSSDASMNGGILTPWGGMPAFTQAVFCRYRYLKSSRYL